MYSSFCVILETAAVMSEAVWEILEESVCTLPSISWRNAVTDAVMPSAITWSWAMLVSVAVTLLAVRVIFLAV